MRRLFSSIAAVALLPTAALAQVGPPAPGAPRVAKQSVAEGVSKSAPVNGVIQLFGNERCPTNSNGEEIVICQRRPAAEQFLIPKEVRNFEVTRANETWAAKDSANRTVGNVGVGTCSTVGAAGATGCTVQNATRWKSERRATTAAETPDLP